MPEIKVCILIPHAPTHTGSSIQALHLAKALKRLGIQVIMVFGLTLHSRDFSPCRDLSFEEKLNAAGIAYYKKPENILTKRDSYFFSFKLFWRLRRDYQIVYSNGMPLLVAWLVPFFKLMGKKVVIKMTGLGFNDPESLRKVDKHHRVSLKLLTLTDRFIGTSGALCDAYRNSKLFSPNKLVQIPNGVDTALFSPISGPEAKQALRKKLGLPVQDKIITYVGGIRRAKGIDLLINNWEQLLEQLPDAALLLIGPFCPVCSGEISDPEFLDLLKRTIGLRVGRSCASSELLLLSDTAQRVHFVGVQDNIRQYLQASDVFLFLSRQEGMPNAVLEAMAAGLPCVSLDIKEISGDILANPDVGITLPEAKADEWVKIVLDLLNNEEKRFKIGQAARQAVERKFTLMSVAEKHYKLYQELLENK
ncbi:MAG: glycosyltransferase family 4 protein [Candidatus Schekmanbacteria bacterium]|nr:glycosyltransferase family 4 protein [Candidatus Schekmanbacteria bacterium]